jgi:hypothetical protein
MAKHGDWIVVKKMEIDEKTDKADIARLLLAVRDTVDRKLFEYLDDDFDLQTLDDIVAEIVPKGRLNEQKIAEIFKTLKYTVPRKLEGTKLQKEIKKQIITEKVLEKLNLSVLDAETVEKYIKKKEMNRAFK